MGMPEYLRNLRAKVGHELLQVPTVGVLVVDEKQRILLVRSTEDGAWGIPGGLIEPFERPEEAALRECLEETGLRVELQGLLGVFGGPECETRYPNGDRISWVASVYRARVVGGEARPDGEETSEVRFVAREELAGLSCRAHVRLFLGALAT